MVPNRSCFSPDTLKTPPFVARNGADEASCQRLSNAIAAHRQRGGAVILSTHVGIDLEDAQFIQMADFTKMPQFFDAPSTLSSPETDREHG
ncbi:MAG: hypothetical protein R3261_15080 [Alphaproteobacteria bacterium]|nr:hypothetical protein [Alphaproteobacteria bacterium]